MNSLYRSSSLYIQHYFFRRVCSSSTKTMTSPLKHSRACSSGDGPSPTRKKKQSIESFTPEGNTDYDEIFPPLNACNNNKSSRPSHGSITYSKSSQSQSLRRRKDDLTLQRSLGYEHRDQSPRRRHYAPVDNINDTSVRHQYRAKEEHGAIGCNVSGIYLLDHEFIKRSQSRKDGLSLNKNHKTWVCKKNRDQSPKSSQDLPFDICSPDHQRKDIVEISNKHSVLRPGMVLLKHYLPLNVQVDVVKTCRELGVKPEGFYQPGYRVGSKLHLQMMCLGRNWDPQTKYGNASETDGKPLDIPDSFSLLVEQAIREAQALIDRDDAERILPMMSPDVCIVNFYSETGRLGLHQDRDESRESITKGLPIVSFSIGDSAEFLYGEERDVEKAEQVELESGDVLIFGGESRMIFHGVKSIIPNSAPKCLLNESNLRTGRLNLTFRHF